MVLSLKKASLALIYPSSLIIVAAIISNTYYNSQFITKMSGKVIAQLIVQGLTVFGRAFVTAYQQALHSKFPRICFISKMLIESLD